MCSLYLWMFHWFRHWRNLNRSGIRWWRTRVQTDGSSPLIVDHFGGRIGGGGFARRIVTLELTSFARSGFAVNETRRAEERGRGNWRKTEKRNKGPIKTNWSSSLGVRLSIVRAALSGSSYWTNFAVLSHTHTHTYTFKCTYLRDIRTLSLVKIYQRSCVWRIISVIYWMCMQTWRYASLINADVN